MSELIECDNCQKRINIGDRQLLHWIHNSDYEMDFCSQNCYQAWLAENIDE